MSSPFLNRACILCLMTGQGLIRLCNIYDALTPNRVINPDRVKVTAGSRPIFPISAVCMRVSGLKDLQYIDYDCNQEMD